MNLRAVGLFLNILLIPLNPVRSRQPIEFSYTLANNAHTSAGVFTNSGNLIRTLWSNKIDSAGAHLSSWDGNDQQGRPFADKVQIRVLENNVRYTWDGPIGNTSSSWTTNNDNWAQFGVPPGQKIRFVNERGWIVSGYAELQYNLGWLDPSAPNAPHILNYNYMNTGITITDLATDDSQVYLMNEGIESWIGIFDAKTSRPSSFQSGKLIIGTSGAGVPNGGFNNTKLSVIDYSPNRDDFPTGIAVQQLGRILAVAHGSFLDKTLKRGSDAIRLFDKYTGRALGNVSIDDPQQLAFSTEGLWVLSSHKLKLITRVGADNAISTPALGLSNPVAIAIRSSNNHLYVLDGGDCQQVKEFDQSQRLVRTYGERRGYNDLNPAVSIDRLLLDNTATLGQPSSNGSWISVQDNGDVWFSDAGMAQRILHLSPKGSEYRYVNQILYTPPTYTVAVDHGDPSRVFSGMFEYEVNYRVESLPGDPDPRNGGNGSWKLVRNWAIGNMPPPGPHLRNYFLTVEELRNGRTYAQMNAYQNNYGYLVELPKNGKPLRYTGQVSALQRPVLERDGSLMAVETSSNTSRTESIAKERLADFDAMGNPIWSPPDIIASVNVDFLGEPRSVRGPGMVANPYPTLGGTFPIYNSLPTGVTGSPHLAGMAMDQSSYKFSVNEEACITKPSLTGEFACKAGYGGHSGAVALAEGHHIFAIYDGQYAPWGNTFTQYYEDGLLINEFTQIQESKHRSLGLQPPTYPIGFAANIMTAAVVTVESEIYIYVATESGFPPIDRWHVSNLSSIHEYGGAGDRSSAVVLKRLF
jgi:hypothetical protein